MQCVNFIRTIFSSMTQYTLCICQLLWYTYNLLFDTYMYIHKEFEWRLVLFYGKMLCEME